MKPRILAAALLAIAPLPLLAADWALDTDQSTLGFVTIKNGDTAESHRFDGLTGTVSEAGAVAIDIPLASVETFIDIRNERMRDLLFQVATQPLATISAEVPMADFDDLEPGQRMTGDVPVTVQANGQSASYDAMVNVTRLGEDAVAVSSAMPITAYTADFKYEDGVAELRDIAELDSISAAVPVTFDLIFRR